MVSPLRVVRRVRRSVGAAVVDGFFRGASGLGRMLPRARAELAKLDVLPDVPYRDAPGDEHHLDVYRSQTPASGPLPVVLYLHGGGFRILSKETHWIMALVFARSGYLVFNADYRLAPRHPFPAAAQDACDAYRWVVANAGRYGGDTSRIVLAGESAGANLATTVAIASSHGRPEPWARAVFDTRVQPAAVAPACGLLQVTDPGRFRRRKPQLGAFLEDRITEVSRAYLRGVPEGGARDLADPLVLLERGEAGERPLPPFFIPCGTKDPVLEDSRRLARALDALGVPHELRLYPGEAHAFHAFVPRPAARECWRHELAFLDRHLGRASAPKAKASG